MTQYALIDATNTLLRKQSFDALPTDPTGKGWRWVPVRDVPATPTSTQLGNGWTEALEGSEWVRREQVREMTADELIARVVQARAPDYAAKTLTYKGANGGTMEAVGYWLDAISAELVARGPVLTAEFQALLDIRAAVKTAHPKPGA